MPDTENFTANQNYPLPHPDNNAKADVQRISDAITAIDGDVAQVATDAAAATAAAIAPVTAAQSAIEARLDDLEDANLLGLDF